MSQRQGGPQADGGDPGPRRGERPIALTLLEAGLGHLGSVEQIVETPDPRIVVVFVDEPADAGVRFTTATLLAKLLEPGAIGLVAVDGASGPIDTSLLSAFPYGEVVDQTAAFLVRQLTMTGAELCHVNLRGSFPLHGVDDPGLYGAAAERFRAGDLSGANALAPARARAILDNLLTLMLREGVSGAALIVCGLLPRLVCDDLRSRGISHALVVQRSTGQRDWERYRAVMRGEGAIPTTQEEIACVFCRHACGAPYFKLPDGALLGHQCLLDWLPAPVVVATSQQSPACFACDAIRETRPLDSPAGPLCTQCRDSALQALTEAVETAKESGGRVPVELVWPVGQVAPETLPRSHAERAITLSPDLARAHPTKGTALEASGDMVGAERAYREGLREAPADPQLHFALGNLLSKLGQFDAAIEAYQAVIEADPFNTLAHSNLAYAYHGKGDVDRALDLYLKVTNLDPDDAVAWYDLGTAYLEKNEPRKALTSFERSVQLDPASYKSVLSLALQYDDLGQPTRAVEYYRKALALTDDAQLRDAIGRTISRLGEKKQ